MADFEVAHVREQGQDMIIIVVNSDIRHKTNQEQNEILSWLQDCAHAAGLAGNAALVWDAGRGQMGYLGPHQWRGFFQSINLAWVARNINKKLSCSG